jgi:uncharacterized SAM-binding protein YcdF (DUF218 family)
VFYFLSKILDLFFAPLTWAMVLAGVGAWAARKKRERLAVGAPVAAVAVLWLFSFGPMANALVGSLESSAVTTMKDDVTYDAVIVLGGFVDDAASTTWGKPSYSDAVERMLAAFDLLRTGRARFAVVSGGASSKNAGDSEAHAIAVQLEAWGIDRDRLIVEDHSRNTRDNAVESTRIIHERGFEKLVLVTSAMHMKRAAGCFVATGLSFDTFAVDFHSHGSRFGNDWPPRADKLDVSTGALREHLGRVVYRVRGYSAAWP